MCLGQFRISAPRGSDADRPSRGEASLDDGRETGLEDGLDTGRDVGLDGDADAASDCRRLTVWVPCPEGPNP